MPVLSTDGNIIMKDKGQIALGSAGNGAFFDTLNQNEDLMTLMQEELDFV